MGRRAQRSLVGGVIALGAVAGLLLAIYLSSRPAPSIGNASPSPAVPSATTRAPAPSVAPTAPAEPSSAEAATATPVPSGPARIAWGGGSSHDGWVSSVVQFDGRWIAGGTSRAGSGEWATVWTSVDGRAWSEPLTFGPQPDEHTRYVVTGFGLWNGDLLAMGWKGATGSDSGSPMLWRSPDGERWDAVDIAGTAYDTWQHGRGSVITPDGSLAVISMTGLGPGASAFLTADIQSWEEHPIVDWSTEVVVTGFAASPDRLLAVGVLQLPYEDGSDEPRFEQRAWVSNDAVTWTAIAPPTDLGELSAVTWDAAHGRFVVVGSDVDGIPHAWLATDAERWSAIPLLTSPARMHGVSAVDGLVVATGVSGSPFEPDSGETIAWSSFDGLTWWYAPVLDWQGRTLVSSARSSSVLIANRWLEDRGDTWIALAGTAASTE